VPLCDHVANLGYIDRLLLEENIVTTHGRKAMLKYLIILASSAVACERFCRNGEGLKTLANVLENNSNDGKECLVCSGRAPPRARRTVHPGQCSAGRLTSVRLCIERTIVGSRRRAHLTRCGARQDAVRRMMNGAKPSVRTELVAQLEEQGYIESIMSLLKQKNTPMPVKVAGTEVLKEMLADEDEGTAEAVKEKLNSYPEVGPLVDAAVRQGERELLVCLQGTRHQGCICSQCLQLPCIPPAASRVPFRCVLSWGVGTCHY
jgi:hypothetical protein